MSEEEVSLPSAETAIVVVDMQKDFCYEKGALFVGKSAKEIIPRVRKLLERASSAGILTIFTQDWHDEDDEEFNLWQKHCVKQSEGAEIVNELANFAEKSEIVRKHRYSAFFSDRFRGDSAQEGHKDACDCGRSNEYMRNAYCK